MKTTGYGAYTNLGHTVMPTLPPPCTVCGKRHAHFVQSSPTYIRGAGRGSLPRPHTPYQIHMTPQEMEGMIYGPMFEQMMHQRGMAVPAHWEHPPYTPLNMVNPISSGFGEVSLKDPKMLALMAAVGLFIYLRSRSKVAAWR